MEKLKEYKEIIIVLITIGIIYGVYAYFNRSWQLSLYGEGVTLMRIEYKSKEACLSAGNVYYGNGTTQYKRFDCGYKCSYIGDKNNLTNTPVCSTICDNYGCK